MNCLAGDFNQVILNLVVNAAQAIANVVENGSRDRGKITVRTRYEGNWAEILVEDTGTGIAKSIRHKVFDHFFTTKAVGKGTGQGLAIAHAIVVQKHGGTISFESEEGKGTTFIIRLPITDRVETEETVESEQLGIGLQTSWLKLIKGIYHESGIHSVGGNCLVQELQMAQKDSPALVLGIFSLSGELLTANCGMRRVLDVNGGQLAPRPTAL